MANNKDFIVKNAVEVGGSTKTTLGTITSSNIDLSTGNYFNDTLTTNTTYTISNAGNVQSFQFEVTGTSVASYGLNPEPVYQSKSFALNSQDTAPQGIWFKPDGTKAYMVGFTNDRIFQYSLSTAWDLSTISYDSVSTSVSSQDSVPKDVQFKPDGTVMIVYGAANEEAFQYTLSTAWNVSTASYASKSANFSSLGPSVSSRNGIFVGDNGTKMYMVAASTDAVYQYTLSTVYDLSTASYASKSFSVSSQNTNPHKIIFNDAGTTMILIGQAPFKLFQYTLSTAWDVSTASYSTYEFNPSDQMSSCLDAFANEDGDLYILDENTDTLFQYAMSAPATITWPSSIKWTGGSAPNTPGASQTDLFTFSTDDGGTSYYGFKTATNLS